MGSNLLFNKEDRQHLDQYFLWNGGHLFAIIETREILLLYSSFYEGNSSVIQISYEPEQWRENW
ncbi:MAG: hypothetical protein ACJ748_13040 [Flavisolibacter sp.]